MDRLSSLDTWFLELEREVQQLRVGSALLFEGPAPTLDQLSAATEGRGRDLRARPGRGEGDPAGVRHGRPDRAPAPLGLVALVR